MKNLSAAAYAKLVKDVAIRTKSDDDRAEDAVQDAVMALLTREAAGEKIINEAGFLRTVAIRAIWSRLRHETCLAWAGDEDTYTKVGDKGASDPSSRFLGEHGSRVLQLLADGYPATEVAALVGISRMTVAAIRDAWIYDGIED